MPLALFDIDGTLVTGPGTERGFFRELLRRGLVGPGQLAAFAGFALDHWREYGADLFKKDKAWLVGLPVDEVQAIAVEWVRTGLAHRWHGCCLERLHQHQAAGDRVVLLSGTPSFVAEAIRRELGVDEALGSECAVLDGRFVAGPPRCHPYGEAKLTLARELVRRHGLDLGQVVAYADSIQDLPLLEAVGRAVAVRPDRRLGAIARSAGWEILGKR